MNQKETRKTVGTLALASFLNDLGSDMIYPIWPLFLTAVLGANMTVLGFLDGLGEAVVSGSQAISGYMSDRLRRRKVFIWMGYLFGSISRVGYALSTAWEHVIPMRILDRAGKIRVAPRDAIIADISTKENRGKYFGFVRAMDNLGAVCGILLCILLFEFGYRNLLLLAAIPSAVGTLLILSFLKEKKSSEGTISEGPFLKYLDRNFRLFLLGSSIFALGSFSYSFLLIYAKEFGFQASFVPVLYLIFTAVASVFSLPFGKLSDKMGRRTVLIISYALWGLVCLSFLFARSYSAMIFAFLLYGLHKGAIETVQRTLVSELAPVPFRASSLGGFHMVVGICALPSSLMAGLLWDNIGLDAPLYVSLGLTLLSTAIIVFVKEPEA